jgi:hypothetical protein
MAPRSPSLPKVRQWDAFELRLDGPADGNPFTDVQLRATFVCRDQRITADGFYDGDGQYVVRCMPDALGEWRYETASNVAELSGIRGAFQCIPPRASVHGPVRVAGARHFAYADGTPFHPLGTTAYAWVHQRPALVKQTLATLARMPFNKIRMCIFPKDYEFNHNEPPSFPYERGADGAFDHTRFSVAFWRMFEGHIAALRDMGIEADVILFHPYDRWGFADMGAAADDLYLRYAIARLSAYRNVWWSLANEFDFMKTKTLADWDRFCNILVERDPYGHLRSIHNGHPEDRYDHTKPWITHVSLQLQDDNLRFVRELYAQYDKPLMLDECGYEGDVHQGWGNLPPQELTCRQWQVAMLGGHPCAHGETFYNDREELWWAKGGAIKGKSPARLAFLNQLIAEAPGPLFPSSVMTRWDFSGVGTAGDDYMLIYFARKQPIYRPFSLPEGRYRVDVIDTWAMTIERLRGTVSGQCVIPLPRKQFMALRFVRV